MNIFTSLFELGRRQGALDTTWTVPRGWQLDIRTGELTELPGPMKVPKKLDKRGSAAKQRPNFLYDTARYACSSDGPFLGHCIEITKTAGDTEALKALEAYQKKPRSSQEGLHDLPKSAESPLVSTEGKPVKLEDWVVLTYRGEPLASRPELRAEFERRTHRARTEGTQGTCLITGEQAAIARTHPAISFGPNGGSTTSLFSVNEGAMQFWGRKQGFNFPISVEASQLYTTALNRSFQDAAFVGDEHVIVAWPSREGTTHPIIPILKLLCYRWTKNDQLETVEQAWRDLETLPDLDVKLQLAGLQHKMARLVIRHYEERTAGEIRRALLDLKQTFEGYSKLLSIPRLLPSDSKDKEDGKVVTLSDCCFQDTIWALITGSKEFSPYFRRAVRTNLQHAPAKDTGSPRTRILRRWTEVFLSGYPLAKEVTMTREERRERLEKESEKLKGDAKAQTRLIVRERVRLCNGGLRKELMTDYAGAIEAFQKTKPEKKSERKSWQTELNILEEKQRRYEAYRWGRYLAFCAFARVYYHGLRGKYNLPDAYAGVLRRGITASKQFRKSFGVAMYVEQIKRRSKGGTKAPAFEAIHDTLEQAPAPTNLSGELMDLVHVGFYNQLSGLKLCRRMSTEAVLGKEEVEGLDDEEIPSVAEAEADGEDSEEEATEEDEDDAVDAA